MCDKLLNICPVYKPYITMFSQHSYQVLYDTEYNDSTKTEEAIGISKLHNTAACFSDLPPGDPR